MKKLLLSGLVIALFLPVLVFAASADVLLTTDVDLSVNSITLDVSGSTASIESIVVNPTTFVVTLKAGSWVKISAPNRNQLSFEVTNGAQAGRMDSICTGSASTLELADGDNMVVTVTPLGTVCTDAVEASSGRSSRGDSREGGGSTASVAAAIVATDAQISALLAQIATLQAQIAALGGVVATTPATAVIGGVCPYSWTRGLSVGSMGEDVRKLQRFLNTDTATSIASTGIGSSGNETTYFGALTATAVKKFQEKYASEILTPSGLTAGIEFFGPASRAKANSLCK